MRGLVGVGSLALAGLALLGPRWRYSRWAYVAFILVGLSYFPLRAGFDFRPRACAIAFDADAMLLSMRNWGHVVLFGWFYIVSRAQFTGPRAALWTGLATLTMGALVEIAQGVTGAGNCRLRDLIPDTMGALAGAAIVGGVGLLRRRA